jgi:hypothetical protein
MQRGPGCTVRGAKSEAQAVRHFGVASGQEAKEAARETQALSNHTTGRVAPGAKAHNLRPIIHNGSYLQSDRFSRRERARKAAGARPEMRTGEPAYSAVMSQSDPTAVLAEMKRTEALLRDARSVLRRVDALAAKASTSDDPSRTLIAEVRTAAEHLVSQLAHRQQTERRSAKQVARRLR